MMVKSSILWIEDGTNIDLCIQLIENFLITCAYDDALFKLFGIL